MSENASDYSDESEEIRWNIKQKKNTNNEINLVQNVGNILKNKYISLKTKKLIKAGKNLDHINNIIKKLIK